MKILIKILVLASISKVSICQSNYLDKNDSSGLTKSETILLDSLFRNKRNTFEFKGKNIAFVTGSSADKVISKTEFFETINNNVLHKVEIPLNILILSPEEKKESNGYDVIIICWSKVVISDKQKKKLLEQLRIKSASARS